MNRAEEDALRQEIEQARETLQTFVYIVSHDLGAPLRAITGFSDILLSRYAPVLDEKGKTYLSLMHEGGAKAQAMLQGLLQYSRVFSQGKPPEPIDLNKTLHDALVPYETMIASGELRATIDNLPICMGDPTQITTLFTILLNNATTYRAPLKPSIIRLRASDEGTSWRFMLEDNGIGIPDHSRERVFLIFKRLHVDSDYPGLGLGLAIASRIVERHRGTISVSPSESGGCIFTFTLNKQGPVLLSAQDLDRKEPHAA